MSKLQSEPEWGNTGVYVRSPSSVDGWFHPHWRPELEQCEGLDAGSRLPDIRRGEPSHR